MTINKKYDPTSENAQAGDSTEKQFLREIQEHDGYVHSTKELEGWTPELDRRIGDYLHFGTDRSADHKYSRSRPNNYAAPLVDWQAAAAHGKLLIFRSPEHSAGIMYDPVFVLTHVEPTKVQNLFTFDFWSRRADALAQGAEAIAEYLGKPKQKQEEQS